MPIIGDGGSLIVGPVPIIGGGAIAGGPVGSKPKSGGLPTVISDGGAANDGTTSSLAVPFGQAAVSGDLILLSVNTPSNIAYNTPTGYTNAGDTRLSGTGQHVTFWKIADGTEGTSQTVTASGTGYLVGHASLWQGHDSTWPLANGMIHLDPNDPSSIVIPTLGLEQKKCRAYYSASVAGLSGGDSTFNTPSGFTEMYDNGHLTSSQLATGYGNEAATVGNNDLTITRTNPAQSQAMFANHLLVRSNLKQTPTSQGMVSHDLVQPGAGVNITDRVGWVFTVNTYDFRINRLGLYVPLGAQSFTQNIRIHRDSDSALIAELNLNPGTFDEWAFGAITAVTLEAGVDYTISYRYGGSGRALYRNPTAVMTNAHIAIANIGVFGSTDGRPTTNSANNYMSGVAFSYVG